MIISELEKNMNRNSVKSGSSTNNTHNAFPNLDEKRAEILNIVLELSDLLDVGLDAEALSAVMDLLDAGIHPEAIAAVITELRKEADKAKVMMATNDNTEDNANE